MYTHTHTHTYIYTLYIYISTYLSIYLSIDRYQQSHALEVKKSCRSSSRSKTMSTHIILCVPPSLSLFLSLISVCVCLCVGPLLGPPSRPVVDALWRRRLAGRRLLWRRRFSDGLPSLSPVTYILCMPFTASAAMLSHTNTNRRWSRA